MVSKTHCSVQNWTQERKQPKVQAGELPRNAEWEKKWCVAKMWVQRRAIYIGARYSTGQS